MIEYGRSDSDERPIERWKMAKNFSDDSSGSPPISPEAIAIRSIIGGDRSQPDRMDNGRNAAMMTTMTETDRQQTPDDPVSQFRSAFLFDTNVVDDRSTSVIVGRWTTEDESEDHDGCATTDAGSNGDPISPPPINWRLSKEEESDEDSESESGVRGWGSRSSSVTPAQVSAHGGRSGSTPLVGGRQLQRVESAIWTRNTAADKLRNGGRSFSFVVGGDDVAMAECYNLAKHLQTEKVVSKPTLKGQMGRLQRLMDKAFAAIALNTDKSIVEGAVAVEQLVTGAWMTPKIGPDLASGLCDYIRETNNLDRLLQMYIGQDIDQAVRLAVGRALEECLSLANCQHIADRNLLVDLIRVAESFKSGESQRISVSIFEDLFKHSTDTNAFLIDNGALDYVLEACRSAAKSKTLRHAALGLANLAMYSDNECQQKMIVKNLPDWLFVLASSDDDVTRYYACLAICALVSNKEIETAVLRSGTLSLVEPFLLARRPSEFALLDSKHHTGRPREWLLRLLPMLSAKRREPRSLAAFHFAMDAGIKEDQEALRIFDEIGATDALKQVAAMPEEVASKFAGMALGIIGAEVPHKLCQQVPLWTEEDVQYWVSQIGFADFTDSFLQQKVDGDLLLLLTDTELEQDIGMTSGLLRKRFMRELESLKIAADYTFIDETHLDQFLVSVNPRFSIYTYRLLEMGIDRNALTLLNDEVLRTDCGILNPVHRTKLLKSMEECQHMEDLEMAILRKRIDIFISYRRNSGNQLASLMKVFLQLRGYKAFMDVDRLSASHFDSSILKNIQAAKHFVLILTPGALDCSDDEDYQWLRQELSCALEHHKNIIPVVDSAFEWPDENQLPLDIRPITRFNGVRWIHEYQDACVAKVEKFIEGQLSSTRDIKAMANKSYKTITKSNSVCNGNSSPAAADEPSVAEAATT